MGLRQLKPTFLVLTAADLLTRLHLSKTFPEDVIQIVAKDALAGLLYLHERGVAHRDVKPQNLLVFPVGEVGEAAKVKLCDFGVSAVLPKEACTGLVRATNHRGTPLYMAPELVTASPYNFSVRPTRPSETHHPSG